MQKKLHFSASTFYLFFFLWVIFWAINIIFSDAPAMSLLSLSPLTRLAPQSSLSLPFTFEVAFSALGASLKNAFVGVGVGNFNLMFSRFRPPAYNLTPLWSATPTASSSPALTILVEQGLLGLCFSLFFFYLLFRLYRFYRPFDQEFFFSRKERLFVRLFFVVAILNFVLFLVCPLSFLSYLSFLGVFLLLFPLFFLFSKKDIAGGFSVSASWLRISLFFLISLISLVLLLPFLFPFLSPQAHIEASQKHLREAQHLAAQKTLSAKEKKQIQEKVLSSIKEGKATIALSPKDYSYHLQLALTFADLSNLIEDADILAAKEFGESLKLNPADPKLFFEIGRFQFLRGHSQSAKSAFEKAIELKPDYSTAWYALYRACLTLSESAAAIKNEESAKQNQAAAKEALTRAKNLVCQVAPDAAECVRLSQEFSQLTF